MDPFANGLAVNVTRAADIGRKRSGANVSKVARIPATDNEREAWRFAADLDGLTFAPWARRILNAEAKRRGVEPPEKLGAD